MVCNLQRNREITDKCRLTLYMYSSILPLPRSGAPFRVKSMGHVRARLLRRLRVIAVQYIFDERWLHSNSGQPRSTDIDSSRAAVGSPPRCRRRHGS